MTRFTKDLELQIHFRPPVALIAFFNTPKLATSKFFGEFGADIN
jgi:hypothetical protein